VFAPICVPVRLRLSRTKSARWVRARRLRHLVPLTRRVKRIQDDASPLEPPMVSAMARRNRRDMQSLRFIDRCGAAFLTPSASDICPPKTPPDRPAAPAAARSRRAKFGRPVLRIDQNAALALAKSPTLRQELPIAPARRRTALKHPHTEDHLVMFQNGRERPAKKSTAPPCAMNLCEPTRRLHRARSEH